MSSADVGILRLLLIVGGPFVLAGLLCLWRERKRREPWSRENPDEVRWVTDENGHVVDMQNEAEVYAAHMGLYR